MTDRPDASPWRKLIDITLLWPRNDGICGRQRDEHRASSFQTMLIDTQRPRAARNRVRAAIAIFLGSCIVSATAAENPLKLAAVDTVNCSELRDADVRLACFDAAARRLAEALGSKDQAGRNAGDPPIGPDAPDAPADVEPSRETTEHSPNRAAAPQRSDIEQDEIPGRFEATVVRITRNNVGRHRFYTADGAVWEQTQLVEVVPPRDLPAVAEFRRKLTGNPTIKFDISSRSYRVRLVE